MEELGSTICQWLTKFKKRINEMNNKFYSDDTKQSGECRTRYNSWEIDKTLYAGEELERYKNDQSNPIYLALLEEKTQMQKAKKFNRTTPKETFADFHCDYLFYG